MKKKLHFLQSLLIAVALLFGALSLQAQCPTVFNVSGGGARCSNGAGLGVYLSSSQTGVKYQLLRDGNPVGTVLNGTDNRPLSFLLTTAGTYSIKATNASSGCSMDMNGNATININQAPNISYTKTDISCAGADGSITVSGSGGTPAYLFNIDGGAFSGSNVFTGLSGGSYIIGVKDANTCAVTSTVTIQNASPLSVSISSVNPGDCSGTDGSITAQRVGGVDDGIIQVMYKLDQLDGGDSRDYQTSNVFGSLSKGDYKITIKDSKGCTAVSSTVSLTQVAGTAPAIFNVTGGGTRCSNGAGLGIHLSGSETGVSYRLSNNGSPVGSSLSGNGNTLTFLINNAGSYTIVATNVVAGCTRVMNGTAAIVVNTAPAIFNVSGGGTICANGTNISIKVSNSETGAKYQLVKNGNPVGTPLSGTTGRSVSFLVSSAGTFTVMATNITSNCSSVMNGSATVIVNPLPKAFTVTGGGTRCIDASGITIGLSGSETGVNYQLMQDGSPVGAQVAGTGAAISFTGSNAGIYTVMAMNATTGCTKNMTGSVNVTINPALTPTYTKYYASSCVGGDGTITVTGGGGTPGYLYSIDNGPFTSNGAFTGLTAGDHRVVVQDAKACSFVFEGITVLTAPIMKVTAKVVKASDCSGNDGSITGYYYGGVVDGTTPLEYQLDGDATRSFQTSNTFSGLAPGNYTVTIKDSKGCLAQSAVLSLTTALPLSFTPGSYAQNVSSCGGGMDGRIAIGVTGGVAPYHYLLNGIESGQSSNPYYGFNNLGIGSYTVTVSDLHGCSASRVFNIAQASQPIATVAYYGSETCSGKNNGYISLSPSGIGGVPGYKYSKDGGATYQSSYSFTNLSPGAYTMKIMDAKGCTSDPVSVTLNAGQHACPPVSDGGGNLITAVGLDGEILIGSSLNIQAYPNPFASNLTLDVRGNNKEKVAIVVTDVLGRKLSEVQGSANQQYIIGNSLGRGIYIVTVLQGDKVQTIKIVKE